MGGGLTFGSTRVDDGCTIRLLARQLFAFGLQKAAVALMCQDERVAEAMEVSGSTCPSVFGEPMVHRQVAAITDSPLTERAITRNEQAWFDRASN